MLGSAGGLLCFTLSIPVVAWDLIEWRIPDRLALGGALSVAAARVAVDAVPLASVIEGGCIAAGLCYALWYLTGGIGRGDAKYALLTGFAVQSVLVIPALLVASSSAALVALLRRGAVALPFSPFLFFGTLTVGTLFEAGVLQ